VEAQKTVVTILLVIVVVLSLLYYFLFLVAEIAPGIATSGIMFVRRVCGRSRVEEDDDAHYMDPNINLAENPMFAGPKQHKADNSLLQAALDAQLSELQKAERENQRLREEIKQRKVEAQIEETRQQKPTNLAAATPVERKEFAQQQLKDKIIGVKRNKSVKPGDQAFDPDADI
jgi:hypothetical protein